MNADGSDKRQLTNEKFRLLNEPTWTKDGRYIAARKHFTTQRSLGTGEIWLYHVGGGDGVLLVKRASEALQKELGEPAFTPDGTGVYYSRNVSPGNTFQYAQDSNTSLFEIERYDLADGEVYTVVSGAGGSVRPTPSPDGKKLAFVRRERGKSKLYVKDLASGQITKLYDALDQDLQETWAVHGLYPDHGLDAGFPHRRLLGRRQDPPRRARWRLQRHSLPRQRHAPRHRSAAPAGRSRA